MSVPKDRFCLTADNGLISRPFVELWVTKSGLAGLEEKVLQEDSEGESCSALSTDGDIDFDSYKCHRTIVQHDGVTDIIISDSARASTETEVVLRLKFPGIRNPDGAYFDRAHSMVPTKRGGAQISSATIQDASMKVTVLADWQTSVTSSGEGIVDVVIQRKDQGRDESVHRIRVTK